MAMLDAWPTFHRLAEMLPSLMSSPFMGMPQSRVGQRTFPACMLTKCRTFVAFFGLGAVAESGQSNFCTYTVHFAGAADEGKGVDQRAMHN